MFFMSSLPKRFLVDGPQTSELEEELEECRKHWVPSLLLFGNFGDGLVSKVKAETKILNF
jgi:hypothetical protein